jgi:hypothetical protein
MRMENEVSLVKWEAPEDEPASGAARPWVAEEPADEGGADGGAASAGEPRMDTAGDPAAAGDEAVRLSHVARSYDLKMMTPAVAGRCITALKQFQRQWGPVLVLLGGARHGKSVLLRRWNETHQRAGFAATDTKTVDQFIIDVVSCPTGTIGLVDLAGDKLQALAPASPETAMEFHPDHQVYLEHLLYEAFRCADGLLLTIGFPILWEALNPTLRDAHLRADGKHGGELTDKEAHAAVLDAMAQMEFSLRCLLRLAVHARDPRFAGRPFPSAKELFMDDGLRPRLDIPVFLALTKADLYHVEGCPAVAPDPRSVHDKRKVAPPAVPDPDMTQPARTLAEQMPDLAADVAKLVRQFTVQYVQTVDGTDDPNPVQYLSKRAEGRFTAKGFSALDQFFGAHPWTMRGLRWFDSMAAYRVARLRRTSPSHAVENRSGSAPGVV